MLSSKRLRSVIVIGTLAVVFAGVAACQRNPPAPDTAPRTAAFWNLDFPEAGTGHFTPTSQPYSSDDVDLIGRQARQLQSAGVQVGIVEWTGIGTHNEGTRLPAAVAAAASTNLRVTIDYGPEQTGNPSAAEIDADLAALGSSMSANSWLHIDGKPVVFVPGSEADGCATTARWASASARSGTYLVEQWFSGAESCADQPNDWYAVNPAAHATAHLPYSYAISPGYWPAGDPTPDTARDLAQWHTDLVAMQSSPARWHLITSFNDYLDGTSIESTKEYGTGPLDAAGKVVLPQCWSAAAVPITHVVIFSEENKTWSSVGGTQFQSAPYLHSLAVHCRTYADWTETDTAQNSASQYVGAATGIKQTAGSSGNVLSDCSPDLTTCRSLDDNIFRQVRAAGGTARSYVEGATTGCSATGNAAKHVPAMYMMGGDDQSFCMNEVRPLGELDPDNLPTFAWVTPNLCNDMHDCSVGTGDAWLAKHLQPILDSDAYKSGSVLVEVWFDEDHPVPNLMLNPAIPAGVDTTTAASHFGALRLWEDLLGLPHLGGAATAIDLRPSLRLS